MKRSKLFLAAFIAVLLIAAAAVPSDAGVKRWHNPGIAASIAPAVIDTSSTIGVSSWNEFSLFVAYEGDSSKVSVEGSMDGTNWYTLLAAVQLNGVDGTYALQYYKPITVTTSASKNDSQVWLGNYVRIILNNDDAAGDDTLGTISVDLIAK